MTATEHGRALVVAIVVFALMSVVYIARQCYYDRLDRRLWRQETAPAPRTVAATAFGGPDDGEPLTFDELRALAYVETDSWIGIPEPRYANGSKS